MKKNLLSLFLLLFYTVGLNAAELNIYASGLNAKQAVNGTTTIDYFLNASAKTLVVKLYDGETCIKTISITGDANLKKGAHTNVALDLDGVAVGTYTWAIEATDTVNNSLVEITDNDNKLFKYYLPQDVVVDNNPESLYFGRIYVSESQSGKPSGLSESQTRGIYIYEPNLTLKNNSEEALVGYDNTEVINSSTTQRNGFKRLAIDGDGYVYIASQETYSSSKYSSRGVYRMNPATFSFERVLSKESNPMINAIEVVGSTLYTLEGIGAGEGTFNSYSLNSSLPVNSTLSSFLQAGSGDDHININFTTCAVSGYYDYSWRSDHHGGFWGCEFVAKGINPNLVHINSSNEKDFEITSSSHSSLLYNGGGTYDNSSCRGSIGINTTGTLLGIGTGKCVRVFEVSYDEKGTPSLETLFTTDPLGTNNWLNIDGVAFDVADNLYVVSGTKERFYAYATVKATNSHETPARSSNKISVSVPHICAYDLNATETETGYTFSFKSNLDATRAAIEFYDKTSGSKVGEVVITQTIVEGANEVIIPIVNLPGAIGQEMTWKVRLTGPENANFSLIHQSDTLKNERSAYVTVDASPESNYFGRVYLLNRRISPLYKYSGLYHYSPTDYTRSDIIRFGESNSTNIGIMHMSVDENGEIWGMDYTDAHSGVWIITPGAAPANYSYSQFFGGTRNGDGLFTVGATEIGGSGTCCFIFGSGSGKKLYTTQEDFSTPSGNPMAVYNIGTNTTWSSAPTQKFNINNANGHNSIYVVEEGIWITQNRGNGNNTEAGGNPALQFYNHDGTLNTAFYVDVLSDLGGCNAAGMTIDEKNNKLYIIDGSQNILEYSISYGEGNAPTLSLVAKHNIGFTFVSSMCMDYAGNLIVAAGTAYTTSGTNLNTGSWRMLVLSPATADNTTTIPAKKSLTVTKKSYERTGLTADNLSTICLPYAVSAGDFVGAEIYEVSEAHVNGSGDLQYLTLGEVTEDLVAGKPYFIKPTSTIFSCVYNGDEAAEVQAANGLVGKLSNTDETVPADGTCYILKGGLLHKVPEGVTVSFVRNRAYFDLDDYVGPVSAPGQRMLTVPCAPEISTDMEKVENGENVTKYFRDGQLYIRRDGVTYDALGRVVR